MKHLTILLRELKEPTDTHQKVKKFKQFKNNLKKEGKTVMGFVYSKYGNSKEFW